MKYLVIRFFSIGLLLYVGSTCFGQACNGMNMQLQSDIPSTCNEMVMTMLHDQLARPFLYVANKEAGLKIYDISVLSSPMLIASVPINQYGGLEVMNLTQAGDYLYLAIGNHFTGAQQAGIAIMDISNPLSPSLTDFYIVPNSTSGAGIVKIEGNYAYLGAMQSGLIILDVSDKHNILFLSQFIPDINYPVPNPNGNFYNARGMEVINSVVYLCYDAGGLRVINCSNKSLPIETGRFANPALFQPFNLPRAYNNIVIDSGLAYIAVDYCGLEVLNIADTSHISLAGWWNPYNCPNNNWWTSPVHANEIQFNKNCKQILLSTGKSDMMVIDVSNPSQPDSCNVYGGVNNGIGTWGIGLYQNEIYLSYICASVPFPSNWTGLKILSYTPCTSANGPYLSSGKIDFELFPNPAHTELTIKTAIALQLAELTFFNVLGQKVKTIPAINGRVLDINIQDLPIGLYFIALKNQNQQSFSKLMIE